jgi:hypothetical protein
MSAGVMTPRLGGIKEAPLKSSFELVIVDG